MMPNRNILNISADALKLLIHIHNEGYVEYWDKEFLTTYDFMTSASSVFMTVDEFKLRNCGGTYYLACELSYYKLVELNSDENYILSNLGKEMTVKIIRKIKLEKLETV